MRNALKAKMLNSGLGPEEFLKTLPGLIEVKPHPEILGVYSAEVMAGKVYRNTTDGKDIDVECLE